MTTLIIAFIGWLLSILASLIFCYLGTLKCVAKYGEGAKLTKQSKTFIILTILVCMTPLANLFWSYEFIDDPTKYVKLEDGES